MFFVGSNSAILIEEFGTLVLKKSPTKGILLHGKLVSSGQVFISDCGTQGIELGHNSGASVVNDGSIKISHAGFAGLRLNQNTVFINNDSLSIIQGGMIGGDAIEIRQLGVVSVLTNNGTLIVDSTIRVAIEIEGKFENHGDVSVTNSALGAASIPRPQAGIKIDSSRYSGSFDAIGEMVNTGHIRIDKSSEIGLLMDQWN